MRVNPSIRPITADDAESVERMYAQSAARLRSKKISDRVLRSATRPTSASTRLLSAATASATGRRSPQSSPGSTKAAAKSCRIPRVQADQHERAVNPGEVFVLIKKGRDWRVDG
jgi:hypothetical protein